MQKVELNRSYSIEEMRSRLTNNSTAAAKTDYSQEPSFAEILSQKQELVKSEDLKFSRHANERLLDRHIDLTNAQRERLSGAVKKAEAKGIKESLVMLDNLAFIVNVKNNTVVTAVTGEDEKVFSNIDGAVIV